MAPEQQLRKVLQMAVLQTASQEKVVGRNHAKVLKLMIRMRTARCAPTTRGKKTMVLLQRSVRSKNRLIKSTRRT